MISSENDLTYLYCSQNLLLSRNTLRDTFLHWIKACTQIRTDDSLDIRYCTISSKGAQEFHSLKEKQRKTEMFACFSKYYWWTVYAVFLQQSEKGSCFAFLRFLSSFWEGNDLVRKIRYPLLLSSPLCYSPRLYTANFAIDKCSRTPFFVWILQAFHLITKF